MKKHDLYTIKQAEEFLYDWEGPGQPPSSNTPRFDVVVVRLLLLIIKLLTKSAMIILILYGIISILN